MKATRSIQSCTRYASTQSNKQQFYSFTNHPRSTVQNRLQPLSILCRHFTSTPVSSALQNPPPRKKNPLSDIIDNLRTSETTQSSNTSTTSPTGTRLGISDLLSEARHKTPPPRSPTTRSPELTRSVSDILNDYEAEERDSVSSIALRLRPTLGRTVDGLYGDPSRGFRQMERKCKENNIRGDMRSQEKHIRRGQRRKNIRILRWRNLFMEGFKSELNTIRRMRQQGW